MTNKYSAIVTAVTDAPDAVDVSVETKGGFTKTPAREGVALFRFKSYIETGEHTVKKGQGKGKKQRWADFTFELVHPDHLIGPDDNKFPDTISLNNINISMNPKAKYFKLFKKMNHSGTHTNFPQMLGDGFLGSLVHNKGEGDQVWVNMEEDGQYLIGAPRYAADPMNPSVITEVNVPELSGDVQLFLFDAPGVDAAAITMMWNDLEITGEKSDGTAKKNWIQDKIREANDFEGSFVQQVVGGSAIVIQDVADDIADAAEKALADADVKAENTPIVDASQVPTDGHVVTDTIDTVADPLANIPGL